MLHCISCTALYSVNCLLKVTSEGFSSKRIIVKLTVIMIKAAVGCAVKCITHLHGFWCTNDYSVALLRGVFFKLALIAHNKCSYCLQWQWSHYVCLLFLSGHLCFLFLFPEWGYLHLSVAKYEHTHRDTGKLKVCHWTTATEWPSISCDRQ